MKLSNKNILVTGGAGFIGSHLVDRLACDNFVRLVDNFSTGSWDNIAHLVHLDNVDVIEGDVRNRPALRQWCDGIDVVFHLAVSCLRTSLGDPQASHNVNAGGTLNVCQAALAARVGGLVYVSSSEVYGSAQRTPMSESHPLEPTTVYGAAKLAGELYAKAFQRTYELPTRIVRPFNTYGPRSPWQGKRAEVIPRFILQMRAGDAPVIFGDGSQTRDFTYVEDTVSGIVLAAERCEWGGDVVNIASGAEVSIRDIASMIAEFLDITTTANFDPPRPGDVGRHLADITKARTQLGFAPQTDIGDGLRRTIEWFDRFVSADVADGANAAVVNW